MLSILLRSPNRPPAASKQHSQLFNRPATSLLLRQTHRCVVFGAAAAPHLNLHCCRRVLVLVFSKQTAEHICLAATAFVIAVVLADGREQHPTAWQQVAEQRCCADRPQQQQLGAAHRRVGLETGSCCPSMPATKASLVSGCCHLLLCVSLLTRSCTQSGSALLTSLANNSTPPHQAASVTMSQGDIDNEFDALLNDDGMVSWWS